MRSIELKAKLQENILIFGMWILKHYSMIREHLYTEVVFISMFLPGPSLSHFPGDYQVFLLSEFVFKLVCINCKEKKNKTSHIYLENSSRKKWSRNN